MKKTIRWMLGLLLMASAVQAATITQHVIQIDVDSAGYGHVTEKFLFFFNSEKERVQFRSQAQKLGADLGAWRLFDASITNYIDNIKAGTGRIGYEEKEGDRQVKLEYQTQNPIFVKTETARQTEYRIDSGAFESFRQGSVYVIPSNTKIGFTFPKQAVIQVDSLKPEIDPEAIGIAQNEKKIFWSGHLSISGNLGLKFTIEKQITPSVSLSQILQNAVENGDASVAVAVALVLLGMVYFKRNSIQQKIEKYLIEHTQLEQTGQKEEIDIEE